MSNHPSLARLECAVLLSQALTPTDIIARLRARDPEAVKAIFTQYAPALNGVIRRIVRDERVAEEVLQDTLLKVWNKIDTYDETAAGFFTWLMVIARNTAIDRVRLRGYQVSQTSIELEALVHDRAESPASTAGVDVHSLTTDMEAKYLDVPPEGLFRGAFGQYQPPKR